MVANFQPDIRGLANNVDALTHSAEQIPNNAGDLLLLWIGFVDPPTAGTVTTPAGWTLEVTALQDDLRAYLFWKESTGGESFPSLTTTNLVESAVLSGVVPDVDFVSGPFGDTSLATSTGNQVFNSVTTVQDNSYVLYFMSMHRRNAGWNGSNSFRTVNTEFVASAQTGTTTNQDCFSQAAVDYAIASGTTLAPVRPTQGEDNVKYAFEVRTNGNAVPTLISDYVVGANISGFATSDTDDSFRDAIMRSGFTQLGPIQNYEFDGSSDVNTTTNEITVTGHGISEGWVVQAENHFGTLPTGLTDGAFYWVRPVDADTIQLVEQETAIDANSDAYNDNTGGGGLKAVTGVTAVGSGTCRLRDCGHAFAGDNVFRWPAGSAGVLTDFSLDYNGNSLGSNQNRFCFSRNFATPIDLSSGITGFPFGYGSGNFDWDQRGIIFIDSNDEWYSVQLSRGGLSNSTFNFYVEVAGDHAGANLYRSSGGTFDPTSISYIVTYYAGISNARRNNNQTNGTPFAFVPFTVFGGGPDLPLTFSSIANTLADKVDVNFGESATPDQALFRIPFTLGGPSRPIFVDELARSVSIPEVGNGTNEVQSYIRDFEIRYRPQAGDTMRFQSSIVSDANRTVTETFEIPTTGTYDFTARLFVNTNVVLDADVTYDRPNFVGCLGIADNGATITNAAFDVSANVPAGGSLITWVGSTSISSSVFNANSNLTDGHAIVITTPGVYSFSNLTFDNFGADGTVTAAVFNNSGGAVTINVSGGTSPTVRNGAGASTVVNAGVTVTFTGIVQGSRIYAARVVGGVDDAVLINALVGVSGSAAFAVNSGDDIRVTIRKGSAAPFFQTFTFGSLASPVNITADSTFPVTQIAD